MNLEDNVFALHERLSSGSYQHGGYQAFFVCDPKLRHIHKASVADRVLHHAVNKMLVPVFEPGFIFDLYSNRKQKGTHKAFARMQKLAWKLSRNDTRSVWALKCDVRKFFDNMDHAILLDLIRKKIDDQRLVNLIAGIVKSYQTLPGKGLPLGNLTSQLFSNIYLYPLYQWIERVIGQRQYIRYVDDFVLLGLARDVLKRTVPRIRLFLSERLKLELHPQKVVLRAWHQGVDFLGYVGFPHHSILRNKTARRMFGKILEAKSSVRDGLLSLEKFDQMLASYRGLLGHCRSKNLNSKLDALLWP